MTDDDLDARLQRMLSARAEQLDPAMSGPELRSRATTRRTMVRYVAPAVAAAAIVAVALVPQVITDGRPHQQPAGGTSTDVRTSSTLPTPPPSSLPTSSPTVTPQVSLPRSVVPSSVSGGPLLPPVAVTTAPTASRSAPSPTPASTRTPSASATP